MLGLPKATEIKKVIPKSALYTKLMLNTAAKERFDNDIRQLTLVNFVSPTNVSISKGEAVTAFYAVHVQLKSESFDERSIILLSKLVEHNMLFVLEYEGRSRLAVYRSGRLITSDSRPTEEWDIKLTGLSLDEVWENIIIQAGSIALSEENSLDEQLAADEERQKILKQIEKLERQARNENNPRKKFEIVGRINAMKSRLC